MMKVCKTLIFVAIVVAIMLEIGSKESKLKEEIQQIQTKIEQIQTISSLNMEQLVLMKEEKSNLEARGRDLENLKRWLITPDKKGFSEAVRVSKDLGIEKAKEKCFMRYMQEQMIEDYLVYISSDGVRKYKHSYLVKSMTSSANAWWDKSLYNSVDGENVPTTDVVIPQEVLYPKQKLSNFLDTMGGVFIERK